MIGPNLWWEYNRWLWKHGWQPGMRVSYQGGVLYQKAITGKCLMSIHQSSSQRRGLQASKWSTLVYVHMCHRLTQPIHQSSSERRGLQASKWSTIVQIWIIGLLAGAITYCLPQDWRLAYTMACCRSMSHQPVIQPITLCSVPLACTTA